MNCYKDSNPNGLTADDIDMTGGEEADRKTNEGDFANLCENILGQRFSSLSELNEKLNEFSDDELNLLTEKIKPYYFEMKKKSDFINETNKYDYAVELDKQLSKHSDDIKIKLEGQYISLNEAMTTQYDKLSKKLDVIDITSITESGYLNFSIENGRYGAIYKVYLTK